MCPLRVCISPLRVPARGFGAPLVGVCAVGWMLCFCWDRQPRLLALLVRAVFVHWRPHSPVYALFTCATISMPYVFF